MEYRWNTPGSWLLEQINFEEDIEKLRDVAWVLAFETDNDTIHGLFAEEMDDDGYFEEAEDD